MDNTLSATELAQLVADLKKQVATLEKQVGTLNESRIVPEEDLVVIAATAAAYMGFKGKIRAIQYAGRDTSTLVSAR